MNILRPIEHDPDTSSRITLLETLPALDDYKTLGMKIVSFNDIFRTTNLQGPSSPPKRSPTPQANKTSRTTITPSPGPTLAAQPKSGPAQTESSSWATATKTGSHGKSISIASAKIDVPALGTVYYVNSDGERIDAPLPYLKNSDRDALKAITNNTKLCNKFYLGKNCSKPCPMKFSHTKVLSPGQMNALRQQARSIVCRLGLRCCDEACYLGHSCPNEVRLGSGQCEWEYACFFSRYHGIDLVSLRALLYSQTSANNIVQKPAKKYLDDGTSEVVKQF